MHSRELAVKVRQKPLKMTALPMRGQAPHGVTWQTKPSRMVEGHWGLSC